MKECVLFEHLRAQLQTGTWLQVWQIRELCQICQSICVEHSLVWTKYRIHIVKSSGAFMCAPLDSSVVQWCEVKICHIKSVARTRSYPLLQLWIWKEQAIDPALQLFPYTEFVVHQNLSCVGDVILFSSILTQSHHQALLDYSMRKCLMFQRQQMFKMSIETQRIRLRYTPTRTPDTFHNRRMKQGILHLDRY